MFIYLFIYLFICLFIYLLIYSFTYLFICLFNHSSIVFKFYEIQEKTNLQEISSRMSNYNKIEEKRIKEIWNSVLKKVQNGQKVRKKRKLKIEKLKEKIL